MTFSAERQWTSFERGQIRELILRQFRNGLRTLIDPETGQPFDEATIRRITIGGSRFYTEADATDLLGLALEKRHEYQAQQVRIDRAAAEWLIGYHGEQWGESPLPGTGGSGTVTAKATPGVIWQGSTTIPDPLAVIGTDPTGKRYQVLISGTTQANGTVVLTLVGIDIGLSTNIAAGTEIKWTNAPPGAQPTATVDVLFSGGTDDETQAEFALRLMARIRHKPGSGNWSHFRTWARQASNAVADAWIYPCALHAGSVIVAVLQKRAPGATSPLARVPSVGTLTAVTNYIVPPVSPVVPGQAWVLVVPCIAEQCDLDLQLALPKGAAAGFSDPIPFPYLPKPAAQHASITAINVSGNPLKFDFHSDQNGGATALPGKAALATVTSPDCPKIMIWHKDEGQFEELVIASVQDLGSGDYRVTLTSAPLVAALEVGKRLSPSMAARATLAQALRDSFDTLGPGEVVNLTTDERAARAFRRPTPNESNPTRAGSLLGRFTQDAFGPALADVDIYHASPTAPSLTADPATGPNFLTLGHVGVYPF